MKRVLIAAAALIVTAWAVPVPANAESFSVRVGDGYHHHHHYWRHHHGWRTYGAAHCRTVVRTTWRHGHRVTVRSRSCG